MTSSISLFLSTSDSSLPHTVVYSPPQSEYTLTVINERIVTIRVVDGKYFLHLNIDRSRRLDPRNTNAISTCTLTFSRILLCSSLGSAFFPSLACKTWHGEPSKRGDWHLEAPTGHEVQATPCREERRYGFAAFSLGPPSRGARLDRQRDRDSRHGRPCPHQQVNQGIHRAASLWQNLHSYKYATEHR